MVRLLPYNKCVQLSKKGDSSSISILLEQYLHFVPSVQRKCKTLFLKIADRALVIEAIDLRLNKAKQDQKAALLKLGFYVERSHYLLEYLNFFNSKNLKALGFYESINKVPLSEEEKKIIALFISKCENFHNPGVWELVGKENHSLIFDGLVARVEANGLNKNALYYLALDLRYIDRLQEMILESIKSNSYLNIGYVKYLNMSLEENQILIEKKYTLSKVFLEISENVYPNSQLPEESESYLIRTAALIIKKKDIPPSDFEKLKLIVEREVDSLENIDNKRSLIQLLISLTYFNYSFSESVLIELYKKTRLYSNRALKALSQIHSLYAYREMVSIMLTTENSNDRYSFAILLLKTFPERANFIFSFASELNDAGLTKRLSEIASELKLSVDQTLSVKNNVSTNNPFTFQQDSKFTLITNQLQLDELLWDLTKQINANIFYAAVGFAFSSGLALLTQTINHVVSQNGHFELIVGSLQSLEQNKKIDRSTVAWLNKHIAMGDLSLYTYKKSFFHGKFYFLSNGKESYVIIGSSNISKTAYMDNYELDVLFHLDSDKKNNMFTEWYNSFKHECTQITSLEENIFDDLHWDSELDIYKSNYLEKMSRSEFEHRLSLSEEETVLRINSWTNHNPSEILKIKSIPAFKDYVLFLFPKHSLAVFESFDYGNAYYTFKYSSLDRLLTEVSLLSKQEMITLSEFTSRGCHSSDSKTLVKKIDRLFISKTSESI